MDIKFLDNCLLVDNSILVIGDMHIGYEEQVIGGGLLPRIQMKDILGELEGVFKGLEKDSVKLKRIVLLGDLKHDFGGILDSEWREALQLVNYLESKVRKGKDKIVLIKGNHDNFLGPIARKREIKLKNFYKYKDVCFLHGHKLFVQCLKSKILIMGHLHPAITIHDKYKKEKFKCFLRGRWKRKQTIILPSFSSISFGYDLEALDYQEKREGFCIIGSDNLKKFEVLIPNGRGGIYNFSRVREWI